MAQPSDENSEAVRLTNLSKKDEQPEESSMQARIPFKRQSTAQEPAHYSGYDYHGQDLSSFDGGFEQHENRGLGLSFTRDSTPSIRRVPVGGKTSPLPKITSPGLTVSPETSHGAFSQATTYQNTPARSVENPSVEWTGSDVGSQYLHQGGFSRFDTSSEVDLLNLRNRHDPGCPTHGAVLTDPWSWFAIPVLVLSIYSTVFSAIFLGIALAKPRWGQRIGTNGHMSFSTASLLSALFAKTVELTFVTVFVALLGQILSRKAFSKKSQPSESGISIAEMNMRTWVMQPGTLVTHWGSIRYGATTILGILALLATLAATFYTTAAEALVAPKQKLGPLEDRTLSGRVTAIFANSPYLGRECNTPIPANADADRGNTCLQIDYAGQGFHNFQSFQQEWSRHVATGNTSLTHTMAGRPRPFAMLYDNTTVYGQWITPSNENITTDSNKHQRLVHNVTMAMPHTNLFNAVREPANHILQPYDLQGSGEYFVSAALPVPALNVLCVGMSTEELQPLIYSDRYNVPHTVNETVVDDLFLFSEKYGLLRQTPPQFPKIPLKYNTLVNATYTWGPSAIYLLATRPAPTGSNSDHLLCSLKAMQYPNCTTHYHAAQSGGQMSVECDSSPDNTIPYTKVDAKAPSGVWDQNWKDIGSEWINSVALSQGVSDSNASIARILTQMIPAFDPTSNYTALDPSLPSTAESLSVLAGCTLLMSTYSSPFIHYWNYSSTSMILEEPQYQTFPARVAYRDYASGGTQGWQKMFYLILVSVFFLNCYALLYLMWSFCIRGQVTDYTEPQNLFALAVNSPPSAALRGACGAGPDGHMLAKKWRVDMTTGPDHSGQHGGERGGHPHFYVRCPEDEALAEDSIYRSSPGLTHRHSHSHSHGGVHRRNGSEQLRNIHDPSETQGLTRERTSTGFSLHRSPAKKAFSRKNTLQDFFSPESPAIQQYQRLSGQ